jgi:hypothetical protein
MIMMTISSFHGQIIEMVIEKYFSRGIQIT